MSIAGSLLQRLAGPPARLSPFAHVDPTHWIGRKLLCAYMPAHTDRNLVLGRPSPLAGRADQSIAPHASLGVAARQTTSSRSLLGMLPVVQTVAYPLTMVWVGQIGGSTATAICGVADTAGVSGVTNGSGLYLACGSSSFVTYTIRNNFGSTVAVAASLPASATVQGVPVVIVAQSLSATDHRVCIGKPGSVGTVGTDATNAGALIAWRRPYIGHSGSTNNQDTVLFGAGFGSEALSDAEMQWLCGDPARVFEMVAEPLDMGGAAVAAAFLAAWARGSTTLVGSGLPGG